MTSPTAEAAASYSLVHCYRLDPATPAVRDRFVEAMQSGGVERWRAAGVDLVLAGFTSGDWYSEIVHVLRADSPDPLLAMLDSRINDDIDLDLNEEIDEIAPAQTTSLVRDLGPVAADAIDRGIERAASDPAGVYTLALLDVRADQLDAFRSLFDNAGDLPILAAWETVIGERNVVIDLWRGDTERHGYYPNTTELEAFFGPLRQLAPRERLRRIHPLPYSPLR